MTDTTDMQADDEADRRPVLRGPAERRPPTVGSDGADLPLGDQYQYGSLALLAAWG
ncbi:MAG: hypothetical protein ACR2KV_01770 [Solirubrobacteraceae bacterium]